MLRRVQHPVPREPLVPATTSPYPRLTSLFHTQWHATTAQKDIAWTEDLFENALKGTDKPLESITLADFLPAIIRTVGAVDKDPRRRTFGGISRGPDGRFADDDIARLLQDATDKGAGAYRARGSPAVLRIVEILGMVQARKWGVCTMNEFRTFLGLKRFGSFEEWNSDPEIAVSAPLGSEAVGVSLMFSCAVVASPMIERSAEAVWPHR